MFGIHTHTHHAYFVSSLSQPSETRPLKSRLPKSGSGFYTILDNLLLIVTICQACRLHNFALDDKQLIHACCIFFLVSDQYITLLEKFIGDENYMISLVYLKHVLSVVNVFESYLLILFQFRIYT